jgi:NAD(P)-dependent dehydrogenase (short-subunit alcohol dehydrogenase family)
MLSIGKLSPADAATAYRETLTLLPELAPSVGPHFVNYALDEVRRVRPDLATRSDIVVETTLDAGLQQDTERLVQANLALLKDRNGVIDINLRGPLNMHHIVLPQMLERSRGRIVNIASDAARVGSSGESVYSACKGGIVSFSKTLAREVARKGITVNVVCPGPTDTPILRGFLGEGEAGQKVYEALVRAIPMKRVGQPDDIPGLVAFLASDEAAFITGQVISVSGGLTMAG